MRFFKTHLSILSGCMFASLSMAEPFAPEPPNNESVKKLYAKKVHLEPSAQGRPLPTNDWWTTLLSNENFPGRLYAYPLTVSADASGLILWYPREWNGSGTELVTGDPLIIEPIDLTPDTDSAERLLFDFEQNWQALGWTTEGNAFGDSPMTNAQHGSRFFVGSQFAASFHHHDGGLGKATSPEFTIDKPYLHFKIAGGNDTEKLGAHLLINGKSVAQSVGKQNNDFEWQKWDLTPYQGQKAQVQLVDESKGGWGFTSADHFVLSDHPTEPKSGPFSHASTVDWGDWHVQMRLNVSDSKYADVTLGRGLPYVWIEPKGLELKIPGTLTESGTLEIQGRHFGIHAPGGTLTPAGGSTTFSGPVLAISALPASGSFPQFDQHAVAIPRKTHYDWSYQPSTGKIDTTWKIETSTGGKTLQGWIPHHYRKTEHDLSFTTLDYTSRRGKLRLAAGNEFNIAWPFTGIVPAYPLPQDSSFQSDRLSQLITTWGEELLAKPVENRQGKDTYWGGKSMLKTAQAMTMAKQLQAPISDSLLEEAKRITSDWLTHEPGEDAFYYARYPAPWNGLVGFHSSYGSEQFTDNHFHYGYLAMSTALIGMQDPEWLKTHAPAAREVVKQYANWQRQAKDYPRLRTFECWAGHSYAGGMSSSFDGNNQESSSEAVGAWAAMFFLGAVLGDEDLLSTGAMGYAIETEAVHEYWNNAYGWKDPELSNWSTNYQPTICSVMRDRDMGAWTWFSGEPIHIYGIQWLPAWTHLHYFGAHAEHSAFQLDQMLTRQGKEKGKLTWKDLDDDWGQVTTAYAAFSKPEELCTALDEAFQNKWPIASHRHAGIPYYLAHACRSYGLIDSDYHTNIPTSIVVKNSAGERTALIYNLQSTEVEAIIFPAQQKATIPAETLQAIPLD